MSPGKQIKLQWLAPLSLPNFERVVLCGDGSRLVQASTDGYTDLRRIIRKRVPRFTKNHQSANLKGTYSWLQHV